MTDAEQDRAASLDRSLLLWVKSNSGQTPARLGDLDLSPLGVGDGPPVTDAEVDLRWDYLEARCLVEFRGSRQVPRLRVKLTADGVRCLAERDGDVRAWDARLSPVVNQPITVSSQGGDVQLLVDSPGGVQHQQRLR